MKWKAWETEWNTLAHTKYLWCVVKISLLFTHNSNVEIQYAIIGESIHTHTHSHTVHRSLKSGLLLLCAPSRCNTHSDEYIFVKRRENDWRIQRTPFASTVSVCVCIVDDDDDDDAHGHEWQSYYIILTRSEDWSFFECCVTHTRGQ